jgi:hypothetical protein
LPERRCLGVVGRRAIKKTAATAAARIRSTSKVCIFKHTLRPANLLAYAAASVIKGVSFLHRSLVPLGEVEFAKQPTGQLDMFNNTEGMCGV